MCLWEAYVVNISLVSLMRYIYLLFLGTSEKVGHFLPTSVKIIEVVHRGVRDRIQTGLSNVVRRGIYSTSNLLILMKCAAFMLNRMHPLYILIC